MGAPGCQQRIERCSVLTANSVLKQAETNSSQAVGVTVKNPEPEPATELWWNDANNPGDRLYGQNQVLKEAETIK